MKRVLVLGWCLAAAGVAWGQPIARVEAVASPPPKVVLHTGDLIFQISRSPQSRAIQAATGARWSHVGLLFQVDQRWQVLEAVQPVRYTPLEAWVARGDGRRAVVKRLRNWTLTQEEQASLRRVGEGYLGRPYDLAFGWSDTHIYCSELVYKVYCVPSTSSTPRSSRCCGAAMAPKCLSMSWWSRRLPSLMIPTWWRWGN